MFVKFEDVHGHEVWVNRERVNWIKEFTQDNTTISFGGEETVSVKIPPTQVVRILNQQ
jgi:competence transcription factor ComK